VRSTSAVPERILICGLQGSGKTESAARIAHHYRTTSTPGTIYWVNTDIRGTVERCNERWPEWTQNIVHSDPRNWNEFADAVEEYSLKCQAGDWLVIDSIDKAWAYLQDEFRNRKSPPTKRSEDLFASDDVEITGPDYNHKVNPAYRRWLLPLLDDCPAHMLLCAPAQPIVVEGMFKDDKSIVDTYGEYGVRASGQKHLMFQVHTVLLAKYVKGRYTLTTMGKDRSHATIRDMEVSELMPFPEAYLVDVAGWQT
jgi:hypothetical protein